jgi:hypothetical protein
VEPAQATRSAGRSGRGMARLADLLRAVCALAPGRHLGLGRRPVPPCLGTCGGGGPGLLPLEFRDFAWRSLQLIHPPPSRRDDSGAEEQDAGEPQETTDPNERTSCYQESPVESNSILGWLIGHSVTPLSRTEGGFRRGCCLVMDHDAGLGGERAKRSAAWRLCARTALRSAVSDAAARHSARGAPCRAPPGAPRDPTRPSKHPSFLPPSVRGCLRRRRARRTPAPRPPRPTRARARPGPGG